jgi:hypothetical protein
MDYGIALIHITCAKQEKLPPRGKRAGYVKGISLKTASVSDWFSGFVLARSCKWQDR